MLKESDNTLAEMLARHVSLATGLSGSSASLNDAFVSSLEGFGLDANELVVRDGSGLSASNSVTPLAIASLLTEVSATTGSFSSLLDGLPVAGVDGSLETRFTGPNEVARAQVVAKTGSISGVRSLAGFVNAGDEDRLVFAFFSEGVVGDDTRTALEALVVGLNTCGSNLADF
jgi:D-alanyl-D-alanine carboxypeptidase/D-alanyl-D-alanine-endopeptidase (penicillin-binding protein 4)